MTLGERIREVRKSLKMTMDQFGERIGVTKSTISNIENGKTSPTMNQMEQLAAGLQITISDLFESDYK